MSHVTKVELEITDLDALATGGGYLDMELVPQSEFRWYGTHVGDYPLPEGFTKADMGKCDYVLRIKNNNTAYEVGVVKRKDGKPGYVLLWDFWAGGHGLEAVIGQNGSRLKQEYALAVAARAMRRKGFKTAREINAATGKPRLRAWRNS